MAARYAKTLAGLVDELQAEIERLTTLAKLGNMRANDYRAMRDKLKTANADIERLETVVELLTEKSITAKYPICVYIGKCAILTKSNTDYDKLIADIKAEAIKEYLAKLYERSFDLMHIDEMADGMVTTKVVVMNTIVKVAKEMVGEIIEQKGNN